ncbi:4'-phosphopantetheinyl transferase family protein [Brevibacillus brevis]|uniref:4'-phosphopantetheinyl transferase family protein n=2 Tax=Brevibacillus brevis TaxID=1393 RepID=UPI000E376AB6|nr:4'-phosphopantetheinyl transferase superfamily protein [Brevibacillus brevis]RED35835.1 phosphopantetheinyl transferase [Brevibacillus brevis]GEC93638.1 hypothetical protein BBR01nite_59690 [Brevibacillus brevis]VEF89056.1 4'-phosphopantetheinyl transferase sfp [Brevibacillus brevis]
MFVHRSMVKSTPKWLFNNGENTGLNLYWLEIPDHTTLSEMEHYLHYLDDDERKTYEAYRVEEKRIEFLLGRVFLKNLLGVRLGLQPDQVRFMKNAYGRPYLIPSQAQPDLFFNLSHTRGVIACVIAPWDKVGIDVERTDHDASDVMRVVFVEKEIEFVNSQLTSDAKRQAFYRIWTRKEAVMKAEGKGFSLPPRSFTVPLEGECVSDGKYEYLTYLLIPDCLCSLVVKKPEP